MWTQTPNSIDISQFRPNSKSRHLNPPLSRADRERFELADEECLSAIFLPPVASMQVRASQEQVVSEFKVKFEYVSKTYLFDPDSDIEGFLSEHDFLFQPLLQAIDHIKKAFGDRFDGLRLDLLDGQLFVLIPTQLDSEQALKRMAHFDKHWWFNVPHEIHDYLEFTIDFV